MPTRRRGLWMLTLVTLAQLVSALASQGIGVWGGMAQQRYNFGVGQLGVLAGIANATTILGMFFLAPRLDRHGERAWLFLGMLLLGAAFLLLGQATAYAGLVLAMALAGLGYSPIQPAGSKAVYHWFGPQQRGPAMGIRQAALPLGGALAAVLFGWLLTRYSWAVTMSLIGGGLGLTACAFRFCYQEKRDIESQSQARSGWKGLQEYLDDTAFRDAAAVGIVLVAAQTMLSVFWVVFVVGRSGGTVSEAATYLMILQLAGAFGRIALPVLGQRLSISHQGMVVTCGLCTAIILVALTFLPIAPSWKLVAGFSCFIGVVGFGWYGPWVVWLAEIARPDEIGRVIGGAMMLNQISIALTPVVIGFVVDWSGDFTPAFALLVVSIASVLLWTRRESTNR